MSMECSTIKIIDQKKECYLIKFTDTLIAANVAALREEITNCINSDFDIIYIDVKEVSEADLSGINEVINAHYSLDKAAKKLILLFKKNSPVEKWIHTTGLDKFVETAMVI